MTLPAAKTTVVFRPDLRVVKSNFLTLPNNFSQPDFVQVSEGAKALSPLELSLEEALLSNDGQWVPAEELAATVWYEGAPLQWLWRLVQRYRVKRPRTLVSSWGLGYRIPRGLPTVHWHCRRCKTAAARNGTIIGCRRCGRFEDLRDARVTVFHGTGRRGYDDSTSQGKPWTEAELQFVWLHRGVMNYEELAIAVNRTGSAVRGRFTVEDWAKPYVRSGVRQELCTLTSCTDDCRAGDEPDDDGAGLPAEESSGTIAAKQAEYQRLAFAISRLADMAEEGNDGSE